MAVCKCSQ